MQMFCRKPAGDSCEETCSDRSSKATSESHNLEPGDHVLRWSHILLYPIQIHGIVLSVQPDAITLIDFGVTHNNNHALSEEELTHLDDWQASDDRRLNVVTLTDLSDIQKWKKVNYGESVISEGKWAKITDWFRGANSHSKPKPEKKLDEESLTDDRRTSMPPSFSSFSSLGSESIPAPPDEAFASHKEETKAFLKWWNSEESKLSTGSNDREDDIELSNDGKGSTKEPCQVSPGGESTDKASEEQETAVPRLPKSDPAMIVLSRVRFLLDEDGRKVLPRHHVLFANSECIAVWCKTGRFSTLQSQIFLHSTAIGNAKTATTVALIVGSQTVTVTSTVPAAGLWGWLGYTTTSTAQVGLLAANPWLIPVLAGSGLAAVGTPYLILHRAQTKWNEATEILNDTFWQRATPDIYVDAIQHWSGLGLPKQ